MERERSFYEKRKKRKLKKGTIVRSCHKRKDREKIGVSGGRLILCTSNFYH